MKTSLFWVICLLLSFVVVRADECQEAKNCTECVRRMGCTWCLDYENGPIYFPPITKGCVNATTTTCQKNVKLEKSILESDTNKTRKIFGSADIVVKAPPNEAMHVPFNVRHSDHQIF